jgi:aconitate hydratase
VDLAAMRAAVSRLGRDPKIIEPLVPVDLVIDHSVQVDFYSTGDALQRTMEMEFKRNEARYQFLKWGMQAFKTFKVIPPGIGICHQVNLEHLAKGVLEKGGVHYPDTLVGTDSHTTMINGLGIVGWGVGGIEAEAGMLGQPVYFLTPDVVGVEMTGRLQEGVTATDLVLHVTEMLRKAKVVGKFVEYHGEGAATLSIPDRATIANMSPEYGATMGFFPVDEETCAYLKSTGRSDEQVELVRSYFTAQGLFGMPKKGDCRYSSLLKLDLADIRPCVAGPKRPQDRIELPQLKEKFTSLLEKPVGENGYQKPKEEVGKRYALQRKNGGNGADLGHGDVVIAAITSCTNTSNPSVMLAAGLLAKKAVEKGLSVPRAVKTSLAPGSRVVSDYLEKSGLQTYLDQLRFNLVGYGCTTCIGNSGPLDPKLEEVLTKHDVIAASVLSGNRNFEARVHQSVKANFLMSPPLVVAFALAGRVNIDLSREPLGKGKDGKAVFLREVWPSPEEVNRALRSAVDPETYRKLYRDLERQNPLWNEIRSNTGHLYEWDASSTYIQEPPYFEGFTLAPGGAAGGPVGDIRGARALAIFGDSVTTDHISPAGAIDPASPAGAYLKERGVKVQDFNSYGSRRGNHQVMVRGTFANVRIKNLMVPGVEGGVTLYQPGGARMSLYDAAVKYQKEGVALIVLAGQEYGTGSSRDWAAKGPRLLGVRAVIAQSFERIHRSNLVGMGVLPCQFQEGTSAESLRLDGSEVFDVLGLESGLKPRQDLTLHIQRKGGEAEKVPVRVRIDTPIEVDYYRQGGILQYVLRQLLQ